MVGFLVKVSISLHDYKTSVASETRKWFRHIETRPMRWVAMVVTHNQRRYLVVGHHILSFQISKPRPEHHWSTPVLRFLRRILALLGSSGERTDSTANQSSSPKEKMKKSPAILCRTHSEFTKRKIPENPLANRFRCIVLYFQSIFPKFQRLINSLQSRTKVQTEVILCD